jgi:hypothetical protein
VVVRQLDVPKKKGVGGSHLLWLSDELVDLLFWY